MNREMERDRRRKGVMWEGICKYIRNMGRSGEDDEDVYI